MNGRVLCSLCGKGYLTPRTEDTETEYRGQQGAVTLHFMECDACGSEIVGDVESRANKRAVLAFRKTVDGLLTGAEIRAIREKYQLTQAQAAKLFGGGPVAFSKYENDDVAHSDAMDVLLRLVRRSEESFWELVDERRLGELLQRRPSRVAHYVVPADLRVFLTVSVKNPEPVTQTANRRPYHARYFPQSGVSPWMQ